MRKNVIIDINEDVSKVYEYLYRKNLLKNKKNEHKESFNIEKTEYEVFKIPYSSKFSLKTAEKAVKELKMHKDLNIILSKNVEKKEGLYGFLKENLENLPTGEVVCEFFEDEIFRKYILLKNKKDYEAEIVIFSDDAERVYNFLKKVCKKIKNVYIVADNFEKFDWVIKKIYEEFGFYIYFTNKPNNTFLNDRIYLNFAKNTSFYIKQVEENNIIIMDFLGKSKESDFFINKFNFKIPPEFKEIMKYFKGCDQKTLEFLIKSGDNETYFDIKNFVKKHNVNLKKICIKNSWQNKINWL